MGRAPAGRSPARWAARRAALVGVLALGGVLLSQRTEAGSFVEDVSLELEGVTRYFDVYLPDGLAPNAALFLALHGGTLSNQSLRGGAGAELLRLADRDGFLVIMPNGTNAAGQSAAAGAFNWNDCRSDAGPATTPADDVGFVSALIDWAIGEHAIDPLRVYVTGASNGGMMTYRLLLELSERIAAGAAVIANLPANSECRAAPAAARSLLIMNGTADPIMPFAGGAIAVTRGEVLSSDETRDRWRSLLGAGEEPERLEFPDLDPSDGGTVARESYFGTRGTELLYYRVEGGGHSVPSIAYPSPPGAFGAQNHDIEAMVEIWSFLSRQSASAPSPNRAGVQIPPDRRLRLVSKDVGGERWAISRSEADGSLTGNVFIPGEASPRFLFCREIAANPSSAEITYDCFGADACAAAPCAPPSWAPLGEVRIPATFFFPPL